MSARRRTESSNGLHSQSENSGPKPRIALHRRSRSDLHKAAPVVTRRLCLAAVISVFVFACFFLWVVLRPISPPALKNHSTAVFSRSFPNVDTLTSHGRTVLQSLSSGGASVSCPTQATFVVPIAKKDLQSAVHYISMLQKTGCPIHLLVEPSQVIELEDLLEMVLPTMDALAIYPTSLEDDIAPLSVLHHAKSVETPWVWVIDRVNVDIGAPNSNNWMRQIPRAQVPVGVHGARLSGSTLSCVSSTGRPEPVAFLVPPFVAPTALLRQCDSGIVTNTTINLWASLGERIGRVTGTGMGGVLLPAASSHPEQCEYSHIWGPQAKISTYLVDSFRAQFRSSVVEPIRFAFALPDLDSLRRVAPTVCRMLQNGHDVYLSVQAASNKHDTGNSDRWRSLELGCHLHYQIAAPSSTNEYNLVRRMEDWCSSTPSGIKVLIVTDLSRDFGRDQMPLVKWLCPGVTAALHLPYTDLPESEWLSMLTPQEWQAWTTPAIELAIITHDRPWSLTRLLDSVSRAHYFGDRVDVVINLEQTADADTRRIAEAFTMSPAEGRVSVRHRIVHAGLMAAVVESWHPHGNHSYGVILEDDVELSPMFYAWIKFCVLRYRYGAYAAQSSQLYGVSLYQPKVTELRMEGRRPFDARAIFTQLKLEHPHTPYLSQVPCSWGAVYFPEHWREFQQYLALRLSEHTMPVGDIVVPELRSNKWSRSWKRFFNEMVYLRGYVSLYPNYEHFVSLSTNHLEVGEHVPANINQEKQRQYFLPLMQSQQQRQKATATEDIGLLDLPLSNLPSWPVLPVLDLWGRVSSLDELRTVGLTRRSNMSVCAVDETHVDALEFLCPTGTPSHAHGETRQSSAPMFVDDGPDLMQG